MFVCETVAHQLEWDGTRHEFCASASQSVGVKKIGQRETLADLRRQILDSRLALFKRPVASDISTSHQSPSILHGWALFEYLSKFAVQRFSGSGLSEYVSGAYSPKY